MSALTLSATAPGAGAEEATSDTHQNPAPPSPRGFKGLRYLEDYRDRAGRVTQDPLEAIKYLALGDEVYVSLGGQHRLRYDFASPPTLVATDPETASSVAVGRNLFHADLHLGPHVRFFTQVGAYFGLGFRGSPSPIDANPVDLSQAFGELQFSVGGLDTHWRVGRQELVLGSGRWVAARDGTNVRQAFDLARVSLVGEGWSSESFVGFVPRLQPGAFDDAPRWEDRFWGSYWTLPPLAGVSVDAFYLGRDRSSVRYRELSGREVRHTFGLHLSGVPWSGARYHLHGLIQAGTLVDASVLAWGTSGTLWQKVPFWVGMIELGLRSDILSGDGAAGDNRVGTFHPLFPNQTFYAALPAIYPANLHTVHPMLRWEHHGLSLEGGPTFFWRHDASDAVYGPPGAAIIDPSRTGAPFTGTLLSISAGWRVTPHLSLEAEYVHAFAGAAMTAVGAADLDYLGTWTTFTY